MEISMFFSDHCGSSRSIQFLSCSSREKYFFSVMTSLVSSFVRSSVLADIPVR